MNYTVQIFLICLIALATGCKNQNQEMQSELKKMQSDLDIRIDKLQALQKQVVDLNLVKKGDFLHAVYFNFKNDISESDKATFIEIINELKTIPEAKNTQLGIPKNTGDKRIRSDYDLVLHMNFKSMEDYKTYQNHQTHLSVKKRIGNMLASPPFVYDFSIL